MKKYCGYYILGKDGKTPIACQSKNELIMWSEWMQDFDLRIVQADHIGQMYISTVFLGFNHDFIGGKDPILWETLITTNGRDNDLNDQYIRYSTYDEAIAGHRKAVLLCRTGNESAS